MTSIYSIEEHSHRFSAWAASTAARSSPLCRFDVEVGVKILEKGGFNASFTIEQLPEPELIDQIHEQWRIKIIKAAEEQGKSFTHGVAAKLINCYLKSRFVCGGCSTDRRVICLHPPIDSQLLQKLAQEDIGKCKSKWQAFDKIRWSKYDAKTYQAVIELVRHVLPADAPLWAIEKYWEGYQ
ncbi:MAG: hypothetical protein ACR65R_11535 [Methylomicrobium sp.]